MTMYFPGMNCDEEQKRCGRPSQLWSMLPIAYEDGPARGCRALQVNSGAGLRYTILTDRGMDIYDAEYMGVSLAWLSAVGVAHPSYFVEAGFQSHKSWPAGLLSTCGLLQAGHPEVDGEKQHGLHGRYKGLPAESVKIEETVADGLPCFSASGLIRECEPITGCHLLNRRTITTPFRKPEIHLVDEVVNMSDRAEEIMIVYHINLGHPLLSEHSRLVVAADKTIPHDSDASRKGLANWNTYGPPHPGNEDEVYLHHLKADGNGLSRMLFCNPELGDGLGLEITAPHESIPCLSQWKHLREREYVTGIEPGSAFVMGRTKEREAGRLVKLQPGESHVLKINLKVVTGQDLLDCEREIQSIVD
jgi:Domain of unknown function (DUF4432)